MKEQLEKLYLEDGLSSLQIAKIYGRSKSYILTKLRQYNIERRPMYLAKRKNIVHDDYFKTWSSNMAYILGIIITDGNIRNGLLQISVANKDRYLLEFIASEISPDTKIYEEDNHGYGAVRIIIKSPIIFEDLQKLGVVPRKSGKETLPPNIPNEFLPDLIRGILDGDGTISMSTKPQINIGCSNREFLEQIQSLLSIGKIYLSSKNYYVWSLTKQSEMKEFINYIYNDNFCLNRKCNEAEKVLKFIDRQRKKPGRKKSIK